MSAPADPPDPHAGPATPPEHPRRPRLEPTRGSTLVLAAVIPLALTWLLISRFYGALPRLPWAPATCAAVLAVVTAVLAGQTRARLAGRPGREPVAPLLTARFAVLAKTSSLTGAVFTGMYGGALTWLAVEEQRTGSTAARTADLPIAVAGVVASLLLIAGGLWLERACRVPPRDDDPDPPQE